MDDLASRRDAEREKYEEILRSWPTYGDANHGRPALRYVLDELEPESVLDVGCGGNQFVKLCRDSGISNAVGVDIAHPMADIIAPAHDLWMIDDNAFDLVTAFDVLEHLLPEEIDDCLGEWSAVSRRFLVSPAFFPHHRNGVDYHMTVKPPEWWLAKLNEFGYTTEAPIPCNRMQRVYYVGEWR